jgi:hypothetical protein
MQHGKWRPAAAKAKEPVIRMALGLRNLRNSGLPLGFFAQF